VFLMAQTAARAMKETGGGLIVNVQRPAGEAQAGVWAARAGLKGLTEALRAEWARLGVRVELIEGEAEPEATAEAVARQFEAHFEGRG
jgi:NAD(P)-dependent dehydrogenase (short-subunit alcohol dehydrogenase family)